MIQTGDAVATSWKETESNSSPDRVSVMFMLNRMCSRCASESSDGENKIRMFDLCPSELLSVWIHCAP